MRLAITSISAVVLLFAFSAQAQISTAGHERDSLLIIFKDGHQQSIPVSDIARIQFAAGSASAVGRGRFLGRWKVGVGDGIGGTFFITLNRDGDATKTIGSNHGTWDVVDGEARIAWDDGWHDAIRRVKGRDDGYEKAAFSPDKTFSDSPSNVTKAKRVDASPI